METIVSSNGHIIENLEVTVLFPRKRAPFSDFAMINLNRTLPIHELSGLEAKILLQLVFVAKPLRLKDLAQLVGTPTSCAARALSNLMSLALVEKPDRGIYRASKGLVHYGRWLKKKTSEGKDNS
jgi:predicted transcriptional regulator